MHDRMISEGQPAPVLLLSQLHFMYHSSVALLSSKSDRQGHPLYDVVVQKGLD